MKNFSWKFWIIPIILIICQSCWTLSSTSQIRYEEVAESVRNVYWLNYQNIYDGFSSNVGWYGTLLIIYKIFGFTLFTAKFYRLFLFIGSIICVALILKKYLGEKNSLIPLITIGLSPTFLYLNTFQTSYGIDIQYLLICVYLLDKIVFRVSFQNIFFHILLWFISMLAWMSYPVFIFYLPAIGLIYLTKFFKSPDNLFSKTKLLLTSLITFLLPLVFFLLYVKDKSLLWYDPKVMSGIFRGAGTIIFNSSILINNFTQFLADIFYRGNSYNFEIFKGEFSDYYPIVTILVIFSLSVYFFIKIEKSRLLLGCSWLTLLISIFLANLPLDPTLRPGIRRNTASLGSFYALFVITWFYANRYFKQNLKKTFVIIILCLVPLHHLLIFPANYSHFSDLSIFRYSVLMVKETPQKSLQYYVNQTENQELKLSCYDNTGQNLSCRYSEIFAAVAGSCLWNNLTCYQILGFDSKSQNFIPLEISLWQNYYFDH